MCYVKKAGHALFQVLIVIGIIIVILSISINFFKLSNNLFVAIELEKLYSCLLYLQNRAKIEQKQQWLALNELGGSYKYNNYPGEIKLHSSVLFGFLKDAKGPPSSARSLINKAITFKNNKIFFYKDGTISSGIIYIKDKSNSVMYALTTGVSHVTYIRRYKYVANNWYLLN